VDKKIVSNNQGTSNKNQKITNTQIQITELTCLVIGYSDIFFKQEQKNDYSTQEECY